MSTDLLLQLDLSLRLVLAAALGAAVGFEREIHLHPAGMRTHLLVSLGSAIFTELSIYGFGGLVAPSQGSVPDPTRIAAQVVSGIGFLGAGAILKYGASIKGLTTAASLWATAAIGLGAGAGAYVIAGVGTVIVVFSLWPLNRVVARIRPGREELVQVRLLLTRLEALGAASSRLVENGIEIVGIQSERVGKSRYEVDLTLRLPQRARRDAVVAALSGVADVEIMEVSRPEE